MGSSPSSDKALAKDAAHLLDFTAPSVRSAWLLKEGAQVKSWKKRWCVLTDSSLCYYENATPGTAPKAVVLLSTVTGVDVRVLPSSDDRHPLSFGVQTKERQWRFVAESLADRDEWVSDIKAAVRRVQRQ